MPGCRIALAVQGLPVPPAGALAYEAELVLRHLLAPLVGAPPPPLAVRPSPLVSLAVEARQTLAKQVLASATSWAMSAVVAAR